MPTVAGVYGIKHSRNSMVLCPFHNEKTPSAKIYKDAFHCFGCGEHSDVIGFVGKLFSLTPIESAKKICCDFSLNIDVDKPASKSEISEYQKKLEQQKQYKAWEKSAWQTLNDYFWLMREWKSIVPLTADEPFDKRYIYACHHYDYAEYLCDTFREMQYEERHKMKKIISAIAKSYRYALMT